MSGSEEPQSQMCRRTCLSKGENNIGARKADSANGSEGTAQFDCSQEKSAATSRRSEEVQVTDPHNPTRQVAKERTGERRKDNPNKKSSRHHITTKTQCSARSTMKFHGIQMSQNERVGVRGDAGHLVHRECTQRNAFPAEHSTHTNERQASARSRPT